MANGDGARRIQNWTAANNLASFKKLEKQYAKRLTAFNSFSKSKHADIREALRQSYQFFIDFTEIILLRNELPKYAKSRASKSLIAFALRVRKKYESVHKLNFIIEAKLLRRLERQHHLSTNTLSYLTIDEFEAFLKTGKIPDIEKRKRFFLFYYDGKPHYYHDYRWWSVFSQPITKKTVRGQAAYHGQVTGQAIIITKIKDAAKIKRGDILITSMTDPRYVPAMRRAAGIVTDEGGITSHAAIVAREMKKICLIGTKFATQVFSNGDTVAIDTAKGTATKV